MTQPNLFRPERTRNWVMPPALLDEMSRQDDERRRRRREIDARKRELKELEDEDYARR